MNDQSPFMRANMPAPATATGLARVMRFMSLAAGGGMLIGAGMYVSQIALPYFLKPSVVIGQAAGDTEAADIKAKQDTVIAYERGKADAAAQAQAKAQIDVLVTQKVLEQASVSADPLAQFAGNADVACVAGQSVATATANPPMRVVGDWRNGNVDTGWAGVFNQLGKAVADVSCGLSTPLRQAARNIQLDAARDVTAARGLSMTNGAVAAAAPAQPAPARSITIDLARAPHHHLNADQQRDLRLYANGMPVDVLRAMVDGLDMAHGTPDAWYDRVAYYREARNG